MPYRKKRGYRRRYRRKNRWKRKRSTASQVRAPIADSQLVRLKYCHVGSLNAGAGTSATHLFRANDCFDPDLSGTGHQPMGFDQWMNFYNHCTVVGSRIRAVFSPQGAGNSYNTIGTIHVSDDSTTTASPVTLMERTGTVWGHMSPQAAKGLTLTKYFSTKKFFNLTNVKDSDNLKGTHTTGPVDQAHYQVSVFNPDGVTDNLSVNITVEIEYICLLSERKDLLTS